MPYCSECGTEIRERSAFCPECGRSLSSGESRESRGAEMSGDDNRGQGSEPPDTVSGEGTVRSEDTVKRERGERHAGTEQPSGSPGPLQGKFVLNSIIGGVTGFVVAIVLTSVFFPVYFLGIVAGGFLAGFLHDLGSGSGAKVGAVAGFLATVPFVLLVFAVVVLGAGWITAAGAPAAPARDFFAGMSFLAVFVSVLALTVNVLCGVVGGLLGGATATE